MRIILLPLLLSLCFSGCILGPDCATPSTPSLPLEYFGEQTQIVASTMPLDQWWSSFGDGTLNQLLNQAAAENPSPQEAFQRIVEARSNFTPHGGQLLRNENAVGGYSLNERGPNSRRFVGQNGVPIDLLSLGLATTWEIDLFGRIARQTETAEAEFQYHEIDFESIRQILFADIVANYLQIRLLQSQLALLEQNMLIQSHTAELVMQRAEAGVSTELDKSQTDSFGFRTRTRYAALNRRLELEFNKLSVLMGQTPNQSLQDFVGIRPLPTIPAIPDGGLPADLIRRRPEVEDAMINHNGFLEQQYQIEKAIVADESAVELSLDRYRAGAANFQRVIDAQQQLLDDQQLQYQLKVDAMIQLVRLFRATGGDWTIGMHSIENCETCVMAAPIVMAAPVAIETPVFMPQAVPTFDSPVTPLPRGVMTYPLQQAIDPATISAAESPFSPDDQQSVFTNPKPDLAEPLGDARGIPAQPRSIPATSETFTPPTPQPSAESWLWE